MNLRGLDQNWGVVDTHVAEAEVAEGGDAFEAGDCVFVLDAAVELVDAKKAEAHVGGFEVFHVEIFDERYATPAALDVDGVGFGFRELAVRDTHVADAAGGFAADADA